MSEKQRETQAPSVFQQLRQHEMEPSPYMKTRVLAVLRDRQKRKPWMKVQWVFSLAAFCAVLTLSFLFYTNNTPQGFVAPVGDLVAVRLPLAEYQHLNARYIEIRLDDKVYFHSSQHELSEKKKLLFNWQKVASQMDQLPVIVKSDQEGTQNVEFVLLDERMRPLLKKNLAIKFTKSI